MLKTLQQNNTPSIFKYKTQPTSLRRLKKLNKLLHYRIYFRILYDYLCVLLDYLSTNVKQINLKKNDQYKYFKVIYLTFLIPKN